MHAILDESAVAVKCARSRLHTAPQGQVFSQLLDLLRYYMAFPIDNHSGDALLPDDVMSR